ncbi:MAG: 2-hydroxychromene-2-carboxylate isomerase [Alphaproteobacteria bacterium]|nr:2-hydroxychromene-2-carboxylate isomerase [Alphaproteobacteria bacterium]
MARHLIYYMALSSPWAYLGSQQLEAIVAAHGVALDCRPVEFDKLFAVTGGIPLPKRSPERRAYRLVEMKRWRAFRDMPINPEPKYFMKAGHEVGDEKAARLVIAARLAGHDVVKLGHAIMRALFAEERDINDAGTLAAIADAVGLDGAALIGRLDAPDVTAQRYEFTRQARADGVFGLPTYVVDGEIFWGQDRLDFVDRALAARK